MNFHGKPGLLTCVCKKFSGNKPSAKRVTCVDVVTARTFDGQIHFRRAKPDSHLGDFLQEFSEIYSVVVDGSRQGLVEFRCDLDAGGKIAQEAVQGVICRMRERLT
jgi:hypothetical protein